MNIPSRFVLALTLAGTAAAPAIAANDHGSMDDRAEHEAFATASVSLADAITMAETETGARAISAEFENEDGRFVYSVELLSADGLELEVMIDSAVLRVLEVEDEGEEGHETGDRD